MFEGFIKPKRFNDTIKNLTIYSEAKKENGDLVNIFLKKDTDLDFQITYAKIGRIKTGNNDILELYDGQTINYVNKKISTFNFQKSDFGLNNLKSSFIEVNKIQETKTIVLLSCLNSQFNTNLYLLNNINSSNFTHNCKYENTDDIIKELYKRFLIPLYIPVLFLTTLTLILSSKENKNYSSRKIIIFIINFFLIVFSETTLKFVGKSIFENYLIFSIPIILIIFLLINFIYHFNFRYNKVFLK